MLLFLSNKRRNDSLKNENDESKHQWTDHKTRNESKTFSGRALLITEGSTQLRSLEMEIFMDKAQGNKRTLTLDLWGFFCTCVYLHVLAHLWRHMEGCTRMRRLRLLSSHHPLLSCLTHCAGSRSWSQSCWMWLVLLVTIFWKSCFTLCLWRLGLQVGHHTHPTFYVGFCWSKLWSSPLQDKCFKKSYHPSALIFLILLITHVFADHPIPFFVKASKRNTVGASSLCPQ